MEVVREQKRRQEVGEWTCDEKGAHCRARPQWLIGWNGVTVIQSRSVVRRVETERGERAGDVIARRREAQDELGLVTFSAIKYLARACPGGRV